MVTLLFQVNFSYWEYLILYFIKRQLNQVLSLPWWLTVETRDLEVPTLCRHTKRGRTKNLRESFLASKLSVTESSHEKRYNPFQVPNHTPTHISLSVGPGLWVFFCAPTYKVLWVTVVTRACPLWHDHL